MPAESSPMEGALRRDRWIVLGGLAAMTLLSWLYIASGAGTGMSVWDLASASLFPHRLAAAMEGMDMQPGPWPPGYWIIMLTMWWIMMIAMMIPSAAPMILLYARATRHAQANGRLPQGAMPTAVFAGGYLLAWLGFSSVVTFLMWALERTEIFSDMTMASSSAWFSAAVLIFAGAYQLSPLKHVCLKHCRSPAEFLSRHWRPGAAGALRMGLEHGLFCIGCCWGLMALLFVGGIMNVLWIGILSLVVIIEKAAPGGARFAWIGAILLLAWGAATLVV
jgi:predicted metal-binding membrane protein